MLNLVIQDILKAIIKDNYNTIYIIDIYNEEKENEDNIEEVTKNKSKFSFIFIFKYILIDFLNLSIWQKVWKTIIGLKYNQENRRLLEAQIKAFNIENARFPQLGKI